MPYAVATSQPQSKHSVLLALNIAGVLACICTKILLILTALGVIFPEPDVSPVIMGHIKNFTRFAPELKLRSSDTTFPIDIEDTYVFYLNFLNLLKLPQK